MRTFFSKNIVIYFYFRQQSQLIQCLKMEFLAYKNELRTTKG